MNRGGFQGRGRVGAPIGPNGSFPLASGGMPRLIPGRGGRGTRQPLPFPTATIAINTAVGGTASSVTTSQGIFRPSRLICAVAGDAAGVTVALTQIFVGSDSCLVNQNPLTAALFQPTGVDCDITLPTAGPGIQVQIGFVSLVINAAAIVILPAMLGEYIQGGGQHIVG